MSTKDAVETGCTKPERSATTAVQFMYTANYKCIPSYYRRNTRPTNITGDIPLKSLFSIYCNRIRCYLVCKGSRWTAHAVFALINLV